MAELIACLPGDGIGPEVLDQGVRVLESLPLDLEIVRLPFGGVGDRRARRSAARGDARRVPSRARRCCSARSAGRAGTAAPSAPSRG